MDDRQFDRISRIVGSSVNRRSGLRGLSAFVLALFAAPPAAVTLLPGEATAARRKQRLRAEACIPTGKPCPSKKPRGHDNHGKARILSCQRCCQKHTAVVNGETQCACQPDTQPCTLTIECCSGICTNGVCGTPNPSPPPPPPPTCTPLGSACTPTSVCCAGTCESGPDVCCLPPGAPCNANSECCTNSCDGVCQIP